MASEHKENLETAADSANENSAPLEPEVAIRTAALPDYSKALREAVLPDMAAVIRTAAVPDYSKALREAVLPDMAAAIRTAAVPDYSKALREAVLPDMAAVIRTSAVKPNFSRLLREVVPAPSIASNILSLVKTAQVQTLPAGFEVASRELFSGLGVDEDAELPDLRVRPTTDDTAFQVIAQASPDMAIAIFRAADTAGNPLLPAHIIRNMLAWLVVSLIVVAYVGGTVLFPPWGPMVVALLSSFGVTAPAAFKRISAPPDADEK